MPQRYNNQNSMVLNRDILYQINETEESDKLRTQIKALR